MKTLIVTRGEKEHTQIMADEGKTFRRIHDGFIMGSPVTLGLDFSTGVERDDLPEYYEEIDDMKPDIDED